jgi:small conductance mechanosensitive channel
LNIRRVSGIKEAERGKEMDFTDLQNLPLAQLMDWAGRIVGVLVALFVGWIVAGWSRRALHTSLEKRNFDTTLTRFFSNLLRYAILVGVVLGCLGVFGIQTTSFAALIASAGLALGLAFQGTLANFSAGVMLLVFRPFKAGDVVNVAGQLGKVEEIELFTTELTTFDNRCIIIPNSAIFGSVIENFTRHPIRRVDVEVGVAYTADLDQARKVLESVPSAVQGTLTDPAPQIILLSLGASSVDWQVRVWVKTEDYWTLRDALIRATKQALDKAGVPIPFPQMDVHLDPAAVEALRK